MGRRWKASVAAAATGLLAVMLLGGPATQAQWSATTGSGTTSIRSGTLTGTITQSGPTTITLGTASNVYVHEPVAGIVPGIQGQVWTYTITNSTTSTVPATARLRLRSTAVNADYAALRPYLRASLTPAGGTETTIPSSAFTATGFEHTLEVPGQLAPGQSRTLTLRMTVPLTVDGIDVPQAVRATRSTTTAAATVLTMANAVQLTQVSAS